MLSRRGFLAFASMFGVAWAFPKDSTLTQHPVFPLCKINDKKVNLINLTLSISGANVYSARLTLSDYISNSLFENFETVLIFIEFENGVKMRFSGKLTSISYSESNKSTVEISNVNGILVKYE